MRAGLLQGAPPVSRFFPSTAAVADSTSRPPRTLGRTMAKSDITGKRKLLAQNVSHSNIKTKRWQNVNIQTRRVWVPELKRFVTLNLTTRDIRTLDRISA